MENKQKIDLCISAEKISGYAAQGQNFVNSLHLIQKDLSKNTTETAASIHDKPCFSNWVRRSAMPLQTMLNGWTTARDAALKPASEFVRHNNIVDVLEYGYAVLLWGLSKRLYSFSKQIYESFTPKACKATDWIPVNLLRNLPDHCVWIERNLKVKLGNKEIRGFFVYNEYSAELGWVMTVVFLTWGNRTTTVRLLLKIRTKFAEGVMEYANGTASWIKFFQQLGAGESARVSFEDKEKALLLAMPSIMTVCADNLRLYDLQASTEVERATLCACKTNTALNLLKPNENPIRCIGVGSLEDPVPHFRAFFRGWKDTLTLPEKSTEADKEKEKEPLQDANPETTTSNGEDQRVNSQEETPAAEEPSQTTSPSESLPETSQSESVPTQTEPAKTQSAVSNKEDRTERKLLITPEDSLDREIAYQMNRNEEFGRRLKSLLKSLTQFADQAGAELTSISSGNECVGKSIRQVNADRLALIIERDNIKKELQEQTDKLAKAEESLSQVEDRIQAKVAEKEAQLKDELTKKDADLQAEVDSVLEQNIEQEKTIAALKAENEQLRARGEPQDELIKARDDIIRSQREELSRSNAEKQKYQDLYVQASAKPQVVATDGENEQLKSELSAARDELARTKNVLSNTETKLLDAQVELEDKASEIAESKKTIEEANRHIAELSTENAKIAASVNAQGGAAATVVGLNADPVVKKLFFSESLSVVETLKLVETLFSDRVVILPSAWESAAKTEDKLPKTEEMRKMVFMLVTSYLDDYIAGGDNKARHVFGSNYCSTESKQVVQNQRMMKDRKFSGIVMTQHLCITYFIRLYFAVDVPRKKILIGYCGPHLDVVTTN